MKSLKSDNKHLKSTIEQVTNEKSEAEMKYFKSQVEYEALQKELTNLQFQKDSSEDIVKQLKSSLNEKDEKYQKKTIKMDEFKLKSKDITGKYDKLFADL